MLQRVKLSEQEVKRRFLAYLNQRGVVKLTSFCTALNLPIQPGKKAGKVYVVARQIDRLVTSLLPSPACRVEEGKGTSLWEVRYHLRPPKPPSFTPRPQGQVKVTVDPHLKGSYRWQRNAAEELREAKNVAYEEAARRQRQEAREWVKAVVPVAPEPEIPSDPELPSPPSPLSQGGEGGQEMEIPTAPFGEGGDEDETTTTENKTMVKRRNGRRAEARTTEECYQLIRELMAGIGDWPTHHLNQNQLMKKADLTTGYLYRHPELKKEVSVAFEAEKARRAAVVLEVGPAAPSPEEPSPPSPLSQGGEGELETEVLEVSLADGVSLEEELEMARVAYNRALTGGEYESDLPSPPSPLSQEGEGEPEPPLEDLREDYERQLRELREELERTAAVGLREKLEAQIEALDLELLQTRNEIRRLEGELDRRTADLMALRRTAELLGVAG